VVRGQPCANCVYLCPGYQRASLHGLVEAQVIHPIQRHQVVEAAVEGEAGHRHLEEGVGVGEVGRYHPREEEEVVVVVVVAAAAAAGLQNHQKAAAEEEVVVVDVSCCHEMVMEVRQ
jgi:hypothetical protein